jgi:hypothetical protein
VGKEVYLTLLHGVINRQAAQSTTINGWAVTVTAALLGFGASTAQPSVALIVVYVIVAFAFLDAYFLASKRRIALFMSRPPHRMYQSWD